MIVDVRTPEEYETGYIEGAMNLCVTCDAQELLGNLNPEDEILLYYRTGRRSANAARILNENGYHKVYNMLGGITAWKNAGYTVVSPSQSTSRAQTPKQNVSQDSGYCPINTDRSIRSLINEEAFLLARCLRSRKEGNWKPRVVDLGNETV